MTLSGDGDGMDVAVAAAAKGIPVLFVTGSCPPEAQTLGVGCLSKPYTDKMMKAALDALDRKLQGASLKKLPAGLTNGSDPSAVIASAAKQSRDLVDIAGLLRRYAPRNDEVWESARSISS